MLLLALRHWPALRLPPLFDDGYVSAAISVVLLAIVLVLAHRLERAIKRAESAARLQQQVLDALQAGLVLFDANSRIVFSNQSFLRQYASLGAAASPGATYGNSCARWWPTAWRPTQPARKRRGSRAA